MGNICSRLCLRNERWWKAKFEKPEDQANEYSTLIEEDSKSVVNETVSLTSDEKKMLDNKDYQALIDQQVKLENEAAKELAEQEAALEEAEELMQQTRRDAAQAAQTRRLWSDKEGLTEADRPWTSFVNDSSEEDEEFGEFLKSVKVSNLTVNDSPLAVAGHSPSTDVVNEHEVNSTLDGARSEGEGHSTDDSRSSEPSAEKCTTEDIPASIVETT